MAKERMVCPISRGECVECAIYRGRHYYLCYAPAQRAGLEDVDRREREKTTREWASTDETFGMPRFVEIGANCIENVEEIVERREL